MRSLLFPIVISRILSPSPLLRKPIRPRRPRSFGPTLRSLWRISEEERRTGHLSGINIAADLKRWAGVELLAAYSIPSIPNLLRPEFNHGILVADPSAGVNDTDARSANILADKGGGPTR